MLIVLPHLLIDIVVLGIPNCTTVGYSHQLIKSDRFVQTKISKIRFFRLQHINNTS